MQPAHGSRGLFSRDVRRRRPTLRHMAGGTLGLQVLGLLFQHVLEQVDHSFNLIMRHYLLRRNGLNWTIFLFLYLL